MTWITPIAESSCRIPIVEIFCTGPIFVERKYKSLQISGRICRTAIIRRVVHTAHILWQGVPRPIKSYETCHQRRAQENREHKSRCDVKYALQKMKRCSHHARQEAAFPRTKTPIPKFLIPNACFMQRKNKQDTKVRRTSKAGRTARPADGPVKTEERSTALTSRKPHFRNLRPPPFDRTGSRGSCETGCWRGTENLMVVWSRWFRA